ncbi:MAG: UvrD-helicase domain-containing protein, partial [Acidimicrobiales bacterium]
MAEFDVLSAPLRVNGADAVPRPLLVSASAGTGKTWTLAHLCVRFMIEDGVEPDQLLLVTFTRDAARELRGRVRSRLSEVLDFIAGDGDARDAAERNFVARWSSPEARRADERRARHCLANLDGLHARTIHSFAAVNVVGAVGSLSDDGRLWRQATNLTVSRWALERAEAFAAWRAVGDPATLDAVAKALYEAGQRRGGRAVALRVIPAAGDEGDGHLGVLAATQRDLALDIVDRFCDLLERAGRTSYADLVVALAERLDQRGAERFRDELRSNFRVVMIDEFQDTDPLQWHVFSELFADAPETRMVLVGDPKQAIYGFRSGSVETFLDVERRVRDGGQPVATLDENHRSTPRLVDAVNRLFAGADLHYPLDPAPHAPAIPFTPSVAVRRDEPAPLRAIGAGALHLRAAPYGGDVE